MLQCHLCNKPFTNPVAHTRHLRYCLKTRSRPRVRQRSCQACSASKVKCTFQRPSCARCHKKETECVYNDGVRPSPGQVKTPQLTIAEPIQALFQPWGQEISEAEQPIDWTAIDMFLPDDFSTPPGVNLDFPVQSSLTAASLDASSRYPDDSVLLSTTEVTTAASNLTSPITNLTMGGRLDTTPLTISPSTPVAHPTILTLHQSPQASTRTDSATKYSVISIIRGLRSYPLMMTQKDTFPPIIHPHLLNIACPNSNGCPTPHYIISKCMSLSHLYVLRTPETSPYLWDAILEQSNLFMTHLTSHSGSTLVGLSSASLIAAIQAQLIYVIMRIVACSSPTSNSTTSSDPGSKSMELNLNYSIMYAFKKLCETFVDRFGSEEMYFESYTNNHQHLPISHADFQLHPARTDQTNTSSPEIADQYGSQRKRDWETWIVSESWRRMKVIFFLIEKIVDVNMGASIKCTSRYADVDWIMLPCSKMLWEAPSETEWDARLHNSATTRIRERLDTIGGLLRAHNGAMDGELGTLIGDPGMGMRRCAELLDRWHVEADGLGALLNASLGMV